MQELLGAAPTPIRSIPEDQGQRSPEVQSRGGEKTFVLLTSLKKFKALHLTCLQSPFSWHIFPLLRGWRKTPLRASTAVRSSFPPVPAQSLQKKLTLSFWQHSGFRAGPQGTHSRWSPLSPHCIAAMWHSHRRGKGLGLARWTRCQTCSQTGEPHNVLWHSIIAGTSSCRAKLQQQVGCHGPGPITLLNNF